MPVLQSVGPAGAGVAELIPDQRLPSLQRIRKAVVLLGALGDPRLQQGI
jgi:hypothetical protein